MSGVRLLNSEKHAGLVRLRDRIMHLLPDFQSYRSCESRWPSEKYTAACLYLIRPAHVFAQTPTVSVHEDNVLYLHHVAVWSLIANENW